MQSRRGQGMLLWEWGSQALNWPGKSILLESQTSHPSQACDSKRGGSTDLKAISTPWTTCRKMRGLPWTPYAKEPSRGYWRQGAYVSTNISPSMSQLQRMGGITQSRPCSGSNHSANVLHTNRRSPSGERMGMSPTMEQEP